MGNSNNSTKGSLNKHNNATLFNSLTKLSLPSIHIEKKIKKKNQTVEVKTIFNNAVNNDEEASLTDEQQMESTASENESFNSNEDQTDSVKSISLLNNNKSNGETFLPKQSCCSSAAKLKEFVFDMKQMDLSVNKLHLYYLFFYVVFENIII